MRGIHVLSIFFLGVVCSLNVYAEAKKCDELLTGAIPKRWIRKMQAKSNAQDAATHRLHDIVQRDGFYTVALNRDILNKHNTDFTHQLWQGMPTDQKQSGRCWIFGGLNMLRSEMMTQGRVLPDFEFSENYLHFFNMLEKSNSYLEKILTQAGTKGTEAMLSMNKKDLLTTLTPDIDDGGWYEWFQFLVAKYGLVPRNAMPDTMSAIQTRALLEQLKDHLATTAAQMLAKVHGIEQSGAKAEDPKVKRQIRKIKERGMAGIWKILVAHLGAPPTHFDYRVSAEPKLKNGVFISETAHRQFTPQEFAKDFAHYDPNDFIMVAAYPRRDPGVVYEQTNSGIGSVAPGQNPYNLRFLNVGIDVLEHLAVRTLENGQAVWFAADISQDTDHQSGVMHPDIFVREPIYGMTEQETLPKLNRELQAYFGVRGPNHAMLLTGFDRPDPNKPIVKFKVENSWGMDSGMLGTYAMYQKWFQQNVFEIIIPKRILTPAELAVWEGPAQVVAEDEELF